MGRYSNVMPAESGLNIEASAFLPSNSNRSSSSRMGQLPNMPQTVDHYNLAALDRNGPRLVVAGGSLENARVVSSYVVSSETERIHHRNIGDDPRVDDLSDFIDRSLSPADTEQHRHVTAETETAAAPPSPPSPGY
jgi:hypothetical protein